VPPGIRPSIFTQAILIKGFFLDTGRPEEEKIYAHLPIFRFFAEISACPSS
jgi:hypothetical protein